MPQGSWNSSAGQGRWPPGEQEELHRCSRAQFWMPAEEKLVCVGRESNPGYAHHYTTNAAACNLPQAPAAPRLHILLLPALCTGTSSVCCDFSLTLPLQQMSYTFHPAGKIHHQWSTPRLWHGANKEVLSLLCEQGGQSVHRRPLSPPLLYGPFSQNHRATESGALGGISGDLHV